MSNLATIVNNILADSGIDDINVVVTTGSYSNPAWITALSWSKISSTPTTLSGYGITDAVPAIRTITINGVTQDLSADRTWTITAGVSSVSAGTGISVNQTTGAVTVTNTGVLSVNGSTGAVTGIITTSNYNSYSPTLTGGGASGTWGISITGNADTVDGYHATNAANGLAYYASNGYLYVPSWINIGSQGIYSTINNAHIRVNQSGTYGSWEIIGSRNGWSGIWFNDSSNTLMMNSAESGHYHTSYGWQFRWYIGYLYVSRSTYGGGTEYTVLDSGNYNSYAPTLTGNGASGTWGINVTGTSGSTSTLLLTGVSSVNVNNPNTAVYRTETGSGAVLAYAPLLHIGGGDTMWQMQGTYGTSGNGTLYFRQGYNGSWGTWLTMLSSANYSSYALPLSGGTLSGNLIINAGGSYPLTLSSTQRYMLQVRNTNNSINSGYGWWWFMDTNFNMGFHADGAADRFTLTRDGDASVSSSFRAPIFYDSVNTSYYLDPNSSSVLYSVNADRVQVTNDVTTSSGQGRFGGWYTGTGFTGAALEVGFSGGAGNVIAYNRQASAYQTLYITGSNLYLRQSGGLVWINSQLVRESAGVGWLSGNYASSETAATTGAIYSIGGSYYPTSSSLNTMYGVGYTHSAQGQMPSGASSWGFYVTGNGTVRVWLGGDNGNIIATGTTYSYAYRGNGNVDGTGEATYHPAGIYSTGTNWLYGTMYLNTNNIRNVGGFGQGSTLSRPNAQWGASGTTTGAVVIKLPGNSGNYGMIHAVIDIYEYNGNNVSTVIIGGHNWASYWVNYGANVIGYTNKQVRLAFKDGQYCIVIGDGSSSWSYGQVVVRKIQNGTYYAGNMEIVSGITVGIESDSYTWVSSDLRQLRVPGNILMNENLVATQSWVNSQGFVTGGPFVPLRSQSNWGDGTVINNVIGLLAWKNYGNGHVIFDASASTSPSGGSINNTNSTYAWTATYPTLMGWNGSNTYGVRVDSARVADSATSASYLTGGDSAAYMLLYNNLTGDLNTYNSPGLYSAEYTGSTNRPIAQNGSFIQISDAGGTDVKTQWYYSSDGANIYMRLMWGNGSWRSWRTLITDYNIGSQTVTNLYGAGGSYIQSTSTGTSYTANYQVRENVGGGSNTNEIYAPQLAFHWSGVVASSIMMEASGRIAIRNNPGSGYEAFAANAITTYDWFYVNGSNGIYWSSYGGGWRMSDSSYIRAYGGKALSMEGASVDYVSSIYMNGGVYLQTFNNRNLIVKSTGAGDAGILGRGSSDQFAFQVYGSGGDYGFLNSAWGDWDLRKTANGALYMNNNLSYYLNTTNSSYSAVMNGTIRLDSGAFGTNSRSGSSQAVISRTFAPQGASFGWNNGGVTAAIKIRLPFRGNDCMWSMKVRIYNYANDSTSEYTIGNYSYAAGAYHRAAYFIGGTGAAPQTVRFGNDGSYDCVWIGETSTYWSYPQVSVMDFQGGYVRCSVQETANNWDISFVTSFNTVADAITPTVRFSSVYAPIYYDIDNTNYYLDPASTSVLNTVNLGTAYVSGSIRNNGSVADDDSFGIFWDSGGSTDYAVYKEAGSWSFPYPDLRIAFHTGIKFGANANYKGMNFYTDANMATLVLSVNNADYNTGGIYVHGSAYASAFYETSDSRLKKIIEDNSRVKGIELIKPKLYEKDGKLEFGYIAQDFLEVMPYAVNNDNIDKYYNLVYREVHTAKIAYLEDSIEEIKAKILYLEQQLKNKNNENN